MSMAAGGMGRRAFSASCSFALLSFARASEGAGASNQAVGCSWGVPWGRDARVDVRRVWGVGGVVPVAAGGAWVFAPSLHHFLSLPPRWGVWDPSSSNRGCARLGGVDAPSRGG